MPVLTGPSGVLDPGHVTIVPFTITVMPAAPTFAVGASGPFATLSAVPMGAKRTISGDGRVVLDAGGGTLVVGMTAATAGTSVPVTITDTMAGTSAVSLTLFIPVTAAQVGLSPSTVSGLSSWWDASIKPATAIGFTALADKTGSTPLTINTAANWLARLAGPLGGVGTRRLPLNGYDLPNWAPVLHPILDPGLGFSAPITFGANGALTLDMVWTRPNLRQDLVDAHLDANAYMGGTFIGGTSILASFGATAMLGLTNTGAGDTLTLFPNGTPVVLATTLEPRHTHSVRLRGSHTAGWDVFLDGVKLTTSPAASQLPAAPTTATVQMLAGAQSWFHEAFAFPRILTDAECSTLEGYLVRWPRGARKGAIMMLTSQSNGINTHGGTNNLQNLCAGVSYLTGLASFTVLAQLVNLNKPTASGAHGLIGNDTNYLNAAITSDPTTAPLGLIGPGIYMRDMIRALPPYLQSDVCGLWALYSENDAGFDWTQRAAFAGMVKRFNQLARTFPQYGGTRDASNWVVGWNSAIPFGSGNGTATHKAAIQLVVDDPTQNAFLWLLNGTGAIQNGGTFDPATGITSGGDGSHLDISTDDARHALFGLEPVARHLAAIGRSENAIPSGILMRGGPRVTSMTWEAGTVSGNASTPTALITVQHDGGTDLRVPLLGANGLGWVILDGPIPSNTVSRILGTSCVRVSATTLRVRFASAPTQPLASTLLFYIYNEDSLPRANNPGAPGRGNLITDNYSDTVAVPAVAGFDIGADLGALYRVDRPLAAFPFGMALA